MLRFLLRVAFAAVGLWVADYLLAGISFDSWQTLLLSAVVLGIINAFIRPIVVFFTFPFTVITLGLFLLVVNAAMLGLTAMFFRGFEVHGFWNGVLGALVVSIISWIGSSIVGGDDRKRERR